MRDSRHESSLPNKLVHSVKIISAVTTPDFSGRLTSPSTINDGDVVFPIQENDGDVVFPVQENDGDVVFPVQENDGDVVFPVQENDGDVVFPVQENDGDVVFPEMEISIRILYQLVKRNLPAQKKRPNSIALSIRTHYGCHP
ncbi:MAG TPA: hypothetical protein PLK65_03375 [Candidatus Cloacimonas sp.]|nr:hypothetical protein [Candidatus Cloacimonas sp.]